MDIRIKTTDFEMTGAVSDYLNERVRTIEKHLGDTAERTRCEIELGRSAGHSNKGENWFTEIQILSPGSDMVRVVGNGESLNAAIDAAKDEILTTLKKGRTKQLSQSKKMGAKIKDWLKFGEK